MGRPVAPGTPPRPARTTTPVVLPGATRFSEEPADFFDPVQLVRRMRGIAPVMRMLEKAKIDHGHGPARKPGDWMLAYVAFVAGKEVNLQPWYRRESSNTSLWKACGFRGVPAYQTVWERFAELEQDPEIITKAVNYVIQLARRREPRIGMWVTVDGTECQTHAQPRHACGPDDDCPTRGKNRQPRLARVSPETAAELREREAEIEDEPVWSPTGAASTDPLGLIPIPPPGTREQTDTGVRWVSGGHWWGSRDRDAGTRSYTNGKHWHGMMHIKAVDIVTGAPITVLVTPADVNEHTAFPDLYGRCVQAVGTDPIACVADRGYATDDVHEFMIKRDCTPVIPYRRRNRTSPRTPQASKHADPQGIPLCRHCGVPGDFVRFSEKRGGPRLWYRCSMPSTPECHNEQSIACKTDIRQLLPIWKTSPIYAALNTMRGKFEQVHEHSRVWFRSGGKSLRDRPRRIGIKAHQLRANAAVLVEWIWVLVRQGWLGSRSERVVPTQIESEKPLARVIAFRKKHSLVGGSYPSRGAPGKAVAHASP